MDPVSYFITFWIGRYLADVHKWDLATIGWFATIPFIVADLGNLLGGFFTQLIIRKGIPVGRARKISVGIFGSIMAVSLICGPLVIVNPASALTILAIAGFGYAAYTANTMAFPGDVVPGNAQASVWGVVSVGAGLGGFIFHGISGEVVKRLSESSGYSAACNTVFMGYGLLVMGPLKRDETLQI